MAIYAFKKKYLDIYNKYMFLKPANSDMEIALKQNLKMSPENSYTAETGKWKNHFLKATRITRPWGELPHLKTQ